jgi:hypothetical protein
VFLPYYNPSGGHLQSGEQVVLPKAERHVVDPALADFERTGKLTLTIQDNNVGITSRPDNRTESSR